MLKLPRGKSRIGDTGRLAESRLAKQMGGRLTPASGAVQGAKGDIKVDQFLMEVKSTVATSFTVRHEILMKISLEARDQSRTPAVAMIFTTGDGRAVKHGSWVAIPQSEFDRYREWREQHDP